jgi:hypothetical protein
VRNSSVPPGAVYVGRNKTLGGGLITDGIHWGSPFRVNLKPSLAPFISIDELRSLEGEEHSKSIALWWEYQGPHLIAVQDFCELLDDYPHMMARIRNELRGQTLVCQCHTDMPCHADILSRVGNSEGSVYCVEIFNSIGVDTQTVDTANAKNITTHEASSLRLRPLLNLKARFCQKAFTRSRIAE